MTNEQKSPGDHVEDDEQFIGVNGIGSQRPGGVSVGFSGDVGVNVAPGVAVDFTGDLRVGGVDVSAIARGDGC